MKEIKTLTGLSSGMFKDRPPIDRKHMGPFLRTYVLTAIAQFPNAKIRQIEEPTLQQMARDCVNFYWRHAQILEDLWADPFIEFDYGQGEAGRDFWFSRHAKGSQLRAVEPTGGFGDNVNWFSDNDDHDWFTLHNRAAMGWGAFPLLQDPDTGNISVDWLGQGL